MSRTVRLGLTVALAAAVAAILIRGWSALTRASELNLVSGVWLAHAIDLHEGVFYRPLSADGYYGGTRYFPLLFLLIAGGIRAGLPVVPAGHLAGLLGGLALASGVWTLLTRLGVGRPLALAGCVLAAAPYFVLHSVLAIRAEPLAAGLACWGASFVAARLQNRAGPWWASGAAICFTLAALTKPTALYAPAAAVLALVAGGRTRDGVGLAALSASAWILALGAIGLATGSRALDVFAVGALGGGTAGSALQSLVHLHALRLVSHSHYLTATAALVIVATILAPRRVLTLPGLLMLLAALASAVALGTPGTILTNQAVEPYVAAAVYLTWVAWTTTRLRPFAHLILAVLLLWASAHNVREVARAAPRPDPAADSVARIVDACGPAFLSESPLLPVLVGSRPILLDPFAFRVAALKQPHLTEDLVARLRAREFRCVVLEMDPATPQGSGWYAHVHLGTAVVDAVSTYYVGDDLAGGRRLYTPAW